VRLVFTPHGWGDYLHWQAADRTMLQRVNRLLDDMLRDPFTGIGKPEPLRHILQGWQLVAEEWSVVPIRAVE